LRALSKGDDSYFVKKAGGVKKALLTAFQRANDLLITKMGQDPQQWQWGKLHRLTIPHPFGILVSTFNLGPFPIGGVRKMWTILIEF
jgi:acyl-homoserine lactone acylase PvdQ